MQTKLVVSMVVAGALAGCSGGDSDIPLIVGDPLEPSNILVAPEYASLAAFSSASEAISGTAEQLGSTDPTTLPTSGTANFLGTLTISADEFDGVDPSVGGGIAIEIEFADVARETVVRGIAENFYDAAGTQVEGTLTLTEASDLSSSGFDMVLEGQLENVGAAGDDATFDYEVEIAQGFRGNGVEALDGLGVATATQTGTGNTNTLVATSGLVRD